MENLTTHILLLFIVMSFLFTVKKVIRLISYKSETIVETYNNKIKLLKSKKIIVENYLIQSFKIIVNQFFLLT